MSVVLALFLPPLAPAVDADRLIGFHDIRNLKVWIHLFKKTHTDLFPESTKNVQSGS